MHVMKKYEVYTDFNGIVIFEPTRLCNYFGGQIQEGSDLFSLFTSSEVGDDVVKQGIVIPILGIDDAGYSVELYINEQPNVKQNIIFENGVFPLAVAERLVIADLAVFKEWIYDLGWIDLDVARGFYSCVLRGYSEKDVDNNILDCGYNLILTQTDQLPDFTGKLDIDSKVLY